MNLIWVAKPWCEVFTNRLTGNSERFVVGEFCVRLHRFLFWTLHATAICHSRSKHSICFTQFQLSTSNMRKLWEMHLCNNCTEANLPGKCLKRHMLTIHTRHMLSPQLSITNWLRGSTARMRSYKLSFVRTASDHNSRGLGGAQHRALWDDKTCFRGRRKLLVKWMEPEEFPFSFHSIESNHWEIIRYPFVYKNWYCETRLHMEDLHNILPVHHTAVLVSQSKY